MTEPAAVHEAGEILEIAGDGDVVRIRQVMRSLAIEARLSLVEQTKVVTAASELARNTLVHGGGGAARLEIIRLDGRCGVKATFTDTGPGIADVRLAFSDGFTTGGGLGLGLSGSRRLVDEFDLQTQVGVGTEVTITKWAR